MFTTSISTLTVEVSPLEGPVFFCRRLSSTLSSSRKAWSWLACTLVSGGKLVLYLAVSSGSWKKAAPP